jgi:hypothetical protein
MQLTEVDQQHGDVEFCFVDGSVATFVADVEGLGHDGTERTAVSQIRVVVAPAQERVDGL